MDKLDFNEKELLEALERSGYLLESEISVILNKSGFITENSQVIVDHFTGKSKEIDLTAEYFGTREIVHKTKCFSKAQFVFEIKNNIAPIVLLTKFEHSPNIESWLGLKCWETIPTELNNIYYMGYWDKLVFNRKGSIFTQYCSFQRTKANDEIMALHPDNIYSGFSKITQFCEEAIDREELEEQENGYWRNFIYIPVLLLADDLYELHNSDGNEHILKKVDSSMLVYNYHYKKIASMAYIHIVTKAGFSNFMETMLKIEEEVESEMIDLRMKKDIK